MKSIETFLEEFNCIPFDEKPPILLQAWFKFFAIQYAKLEDPNELFQKLLEDLKKLAKYDNSPSKDHPIFLNDDEAKYGRHDAEHLDKKEQEVKNVVEQPVERGNRSIESLQNFRVIRKSSTFLKDTSQISPVHAITPILLIEEPEHSLSMGYEHLSTTPETESDEVTESSTKNLSPIPSECEVTSEDENEINSNKLDPHCFNVESDFVESLLNRDTFINSSSKFDFSGELAHINPEITESDFYFEEEIHLSENLLYDNSSSRPPEEHNADEERIKREHADYISRMEMLFTINPRPRPTVNANAIVESFPPLPIPVQDSDSQREEIDIVTDMDDALPPSVENDDDTNKEIDAVDDLRVDNFISNSANEFFDDEESDFDNPSVPLPPPEPPDAEFDFEPDAEKEIPVVMNEKDEFNDENDDYSLFMFIFLPYLICSKMFLSFLSAESEDTIFDPGISV
nr:hypothetical protein [Tanacetum cinerariifolium]